MKQKQIISTGKITGWVERRLFNSKKFAILKLAIELGIPKEELAHLEDWAAKPMFKDNFVWKFVKKYFGLDLKIPLLFGYWTTKPIRANTITGVGKQIAAQQTGGTTTAPVTAIAIGTGTPSATALGAEITTGGGGRGAASVSNQTTTTTGDTERWVKTFTFTASFAVTEEGLFDNNVTGGNMLASQSFSAVNVVNTDTLQITHNVKFA